VIYHHGDVTLVSFQEIINSAFAQNYATSRARVFLLSTSRSPVIIDIAYCRGAMIERDDRTLICILISLLFFYHLSPSRHYLLAAQGARG